MLPEIPPEAPPVSSAVETLPPEKDMSRVFEAVLPLLADLHRAGVIPTEDHVRKVVEGLLETKPWLIFDNIELLLPFSFAEAILERACEEDPVRALISAGKYKNTPFGPRLIEKAVRRLANQKPKNHDKGIDVFYAVEHFREKPWAEEVLFLAVDNNGAWGAFHDAEKILDMPYAERILRKAAPLNSWAAIHFLDNYKDAPFAESILMEIMGLVIQQSKQEKPAGAGFIRLTTPNGTTLGYDEIERLTELPFAERLFRRLAETSPDIIRSRPDILRRTSWGSQILNELGVTA